AMAGLVVAERKGQVERSSISGINEVFANLCVVIGGEITEVRVVRLDPGAHWQVNIRGELHEATGFVWAPGDRLATILWRDGPAATLKLSATTSGFRIRYRGAGLTAMVVPPHVAALLKHMPVKAPPDHSKVLLCPMPGQVVRIDVVE